MASQKDNRTALTALAIRRMKVGQQLSDVGENSGLRVTASAKDRQFWYRFNHPETGRKTALHIGYLSEMSLSEARTIFTCLKQQRRAGRIPVVPGTESSDTDSYTISRMISDYINEGVARRRNEKSTDECRRILERLVGDIHGSRAATDLSFDDVHKIAVGQLDKGNETQCGVMLRELTGAMEHGMVRRRIPVDHTDPARRVYLLLKSDRSVKMTSKRRSRYLNDSELKTFLKWVPESGFSPRQRLCLELSIQTGCRTGEAISVEWSDLNLEAGVWHLTKNKTDNPRDIKLSEQTRAWLFGIEMMKESRWLCGSPKRDTHIAQKTLSERMWRLRKEGRLPDLDPWIPQDLRRSVRTGLSRLGCPREVAEAVLGHSSGNIVGTYDLHAFFNEAGRWLQKWNDHLDLLRPRASRLKLVHI